MEKESGARLSFAGQQADGAWLDPFAGHDDVFDMAFFQAAIGIGAFPANRFAGVFDFGDMPSVSLCLSEFFAVVIQVIVAGRLLNRVRFGNASGRR